MPSIDDQLRSRMREAAPRPAGGGDLMERVGVRKRRRASVRRAGTVGLVVVVLAGTTGAFVALARAFRTEPIPGTIPTPTQPPPDLGLGFPICDVMSMPITVAGAPGNAYVFTKATDGCPKPGEGHRFVGADLDGNGTVDATGPELTDCFSPVGCEAFGAPDVNGDGTSEIAVSTAGADGYGVWLYAVTTSPAAVEPITVVDPQGIGNVQTGPFQFAWVDVVGHSGGARCNTLPNGTTFTIFGVDKMDPNANVQFTDLRVSGTTATVVGASHDRVPIADAPAPGNSLCGAPLYGSAENFPEAVDRSTSELCDETSLVGDLDGDQVDDNVTIGTVRSDSGSCSPDGRRLLVIDLGSDGKPDLSRAPPDCTTWCVPFALVDVNGDGRAELFLNEGHLAAPVSAVIGVYEFVGADIEPVPFEGGTIPAPSNDLAANRFLLQNSDQGYYGAFCFEGLTFVTWSGSVDVGGTLTHTSYRVFGLDRATLTFQPVDQHLPGSWSGQIPPKTGWDEFCGAQVSIG